MVNYYDFVNFIIGMWDPFTGNCERVIPELIGSIYCKTLLVNLDSKEMLFVISDKKCKLYDFELSKIVSQFPCFPFFDDIVQHRGDENKFVGL